MGCRSARRSAAAARRSTSSMSATPGGHLQHLRRPGRSRDRRAGDERHPAPGRQRHQGHLLRQLRERRHAVQQLHRCAEGRRPARRRISCRRSGTSMPRSAVRSARTGLWYYVGGRTQGNRKLVEGMYYNQNAGDPAKWTYERDLVAPGDRRRDLEEPQPASDGSGDAAEQGQPVLGRTGPVRLVYRRRHRDHRARGGDRDDRPARSAPSRSPGRRR